MSRWVKDFESACVSATIVMGSLLTLAVMPNRAVGAGLPGDVDQSGEVTTADVMLVINYMFRQAPLPSPECVADVNADDRLSLADVVYLIRYLFRGGAAPMGGCGGESSYWPLATGNYWIYECNTAHPWCSSGPVWRWDVVSRGDDTAVLVGTWIGAPESDTLILRQQVDSVDWRRPSGDWASFYRFYDGAIWTHRDPFSCDDSLPYVAVLETDSITAPAGVFHNCLRIQPLGRHCLDAGSLRYWWAPDVGLVRWETDNIAGAVNYVLAEYRVQ